MRLISAGKVLGIDCILKEMHWGLRDLDPVMCLSYVHVACISRDTLFGLAKEYPLASKNMCAPRVRPKRRRAHAPRRLPSSERVPWRLGLRG